MKNILMLVGRRIVMMMMMMIIHVHYVDDEIDDTADLILILQVMKKGTFQPVF